MNRSEFLKALTVKQDTIKLETLDIEVTVRELTLNESAKVEEVRKKVISGELTNQDLFIETCRYAMVEPEFFSDEELKGLSKSGITILAEIFMRLPEIGMTEEQKVIYKEKLAQSLNETASKVLSKEEEEKKPKTKKDSSLN